MASVKNKRHFSSIGGPTINFTTGLMKKKSSRLPSIPVANKGSLMEEDEDFNGPLMR